MRVRPALSYVLGFFFALLMMVSVLSPAIGQESAYLGLDPENLDLAVDPAEDFYRFANGGWLQRTPLPGHAGIYNTFIQLEDITRTQLIDVMSDAAASGELEHGSDQWKAVEMYRQGMDVDTRNAQGLDPIQPILDRINGIGDLQDLHAFQQGAPFDNLQGLFSIHALPGLADTSVLVGTLDGPFLGLPTREYYLDDEGSNIAIREEYITASAEMLGFAGYDVESARDLAEAVYALEHGLAAWTRTREEQQDLSYLYDATPLTELQARYPLMDWSGYMAALGLSDVESLVVTEPAYLDALNGILNGTPIDVLKAWLTLETLWTFAPYLGEDIEAAAFAFNGGVLLGIDQQRPLEERTLDQTNSMLGEAIGQLYVDAWFSPDAKAQVTGIIEMVIEAYRIRLENNTWMSPETKVKALEKLDAISVEVGYPDTWRSYAPVTIEDSFAGTYLSAVTANTRYELDKIGEPSDPDLWVGLPQEVNAFYDPFENEIVFPAAILQAPFFDPDADAASNFGGIGGVIGHEITHAFDLEGSQFDANGAFVDWWTSEDRERFMALNARVVDQYSSIEMLPGLFVNGQMTVTENVADLGAAQVAYDALELYLARNGDELSSVATPLPGGTGWEFSTLTPQQRFFIAFATIDRQLVRDETLEMQLRTGVHTPGEVRTTQPLRNMDEFYTAFGIEPGDAMYLEPEDRIVIW